MPYNSRKVQRLLDERFDTLAVRQVNIVNQVSGWMADSANLETDTPTPPEKSEVSDQRAAFILAVRTQLGI